MSWYSKKDVLDDLAEVMGGTLKDFDEQFIVSDERPPAYPCISNEEEDDELLLRLGGKIGDKVADENCKCPDLSGITEMLRMVDTFHNSDSDENDKTVQNNNGTVISITKLNPDIPDFIPNTKVIKDNDRTHNTKPSNVLKNYNDIKKDEMLSHSKENIDAGKLKEMSDKLKSKIISPTKAACLKMKSQRNLAIATLIKLHSDAATTSFVCEKPKLFTPEYFKKPCSNQLKIDSGSQSYSTTSSPGPSLKKHCIESSLEDKVDNTTKQDVHESLAKVNNWLNEDKRRTPNEQTLFLGPITFKKKEKVKPLIPTSDTSDKTTRIVSTQFVPTEYSNKLQRKYIARNKARDKASLDIWSKLEKDLKERDEIIKQRINNQLTSTQHEKYSQSYGQLNS